MTNYSAVPKWKQSTSPALTYADFIFIFFLNNYLLHLDSKDFSDVYSSHSHLHHRQLVVLNNRVKIFNKLFVRVFGIVSAHNSSFAY